MLGTINTRRMLFSVTILLAILGTMAGAEKERIGPRLHEPADGSVVSGSSVTLRWFFVVTDSNYDRYHIQVSYDEAMTMVFYQNDGIRTDRNYEEVTDLPQNGSRLFWRVRVRHTPIHPITESSSWSEVFSFITALRADPDDVAEDAQREPEEGEPITESEGEAEDAQRDPDEDVSGDDTPPEEEDTSCNGCGGVKLLNNPHRFLGDWLLVGLSVMVLVAVGGGGLRKQ